MKFNIKNWGIAVIVLVSLVFFNACGDSAVLGDGNLGPADGARVKFIHAVPGGAPGVIVYANGKKFTAVNNAVAYGSDSIAYGGVFPSTDFALVTPGTVKFTAKLSLRDNPRDTTIASSDLNLENGKYYLLVAGDTLPTPKFTLVPEFRGVIKNDKKMYLRVVNTIAATPATGYDIYVRRAGVPTLVATVKGGEFTDFGEYDALTSGSDSLYVRGAGATTNVALFGITGLGANRSYTFVLRGIGVNSTGTRAINGTLYRGN